MTAFAENLASPSQVKAFCISNGFHPNKTLGQNFLVDRNALDAIARAGLDGAAEGEVVLEIGPGLGALTEALLARGARVAAIEKDPVLAGWLEERFAGESRFALVRGDALDPRAAAVAAAAFGPPARMVSNLPYSVGTRILVDLAEKRAFPRMTALLQSEVAERIAAPEGSRARSLAGVRIQLDCRVSLLRKVSAACFWPRPEISSTIATFDLRPENPLPDPRERAVFRSVTKLAFSQRRKQLGTVLKDKIGSASKDMIQFTKRAESLAMEEWIILAKGIAGNENG